MLLVTKDYVASSGSCLEGLRMRKTIGGLSRFERKTFRVRNSVT